MSLGPRSLGPFQDGAAISCPSDEPATQNLTTSTQPTPGNGLRDIVSELAHWPHVQALHTYRQPTAWPTIPRYAQASAGGNQPGPHYFPTQRHPTHF